MRCMIVDDEPLVRELLEDNVAQVPFLQLVKSCKNGLEALEVLHSDQVDLIFLDIQIPHLNGIQFLQLLPNPPFVIMVTAYDAYAVESFNHQVADYILKPFSFARFLKACNRAAELFRMKQAALPFQEIKFSSFFVNVEYTQVKIIASDINYIEGLKDYIKIHLSSTIKPVLTRMSQKAIEARLPAEFLIRTHKSFLVAADKVTIIKRDFVCIGKTEIPVSENYRENINRILKKNEY